MAKQTKAEMSPWMLSVDRFVTVHWHGQGAVHAGRIELYVPLVAAKALGAALVQIGDAQDTVCQDALLAAIRAPSNGK